MQIGSTGAQVKAWQAFLNAQGFKDHDGIKLKEDGSYGARTAFATKTFQIFRALGASGQVDGPTLKVASDMGFGNSVPVTLPPPALIKFVQAKNYTPANRTKVDWVTIHDMEYPEKPNGAEWCAAFFAGPNAPQASAHFAVDCDSVVQCVKETDIAWHAPGANHNGIGIEHAGYAKQTREEWTDSYSMAELTISARLVADICKRWNIPVVKLSPEDLKAGKRGICGHDDVTKAFGKGSHWDPGPGFPWDLYIEMIKAA